VKLLDTDVCIDLLRGHSAARAWFAILAAPPAIPGFVASELVISCRDKNELARAGIHPVCFAS